MVTLEQVKQYLRIEHGAEDGLLNNLISVAGAYLSSAVGPFCINDPRAEQIALLVISDLYDNRSTSEASKLSGAIRRIVQDLAQQMRMEHRQPPQEAEPQPVLIDGFKEENGQPQEAEP